MQWVIPEFLDNSNKLPIIEHNTNPGALFYIGEVFVYYVARDQSGNVNDSCAFKVHVKGKKVDAYLSNSIWFLAWISSNNFLHMAGLMIWYKPSHVAVQLSV